MKRVRSLACANQNAFKPVCTPSTTDCSALHSRTPAGEKRLLSIRLHTADIRHRYFLTHIAQQSCKMSNTAVNSQRDCQQPLPQGQQPSAICRRQRQSACTYTTRQSRLPTRARCRRSVALAAVAIVLVCTSRWFANGCYIHGADIGYCEPTLYDDSEYR